MSLKKNDKRLLGILLSLLLCLTGAVAFLALGGSGNGEIKPAPNPSASKTFERKLVIPEYDTTLGKTMVADGLYQVLGNNQLPEITGNAVTAIGKEKTVSAFQWAASFAVMSTYWPPLFQEPLKDDPKWLPGYFSDFIDHIEMEKRLQFGAWTQDPKSIIKNMAQIGQLILVPAESMKFDYPAVAERGFSSVAVNSTTNSAGKQVVNVKFDLTANMYFFKNGKRMVMGILRPIDYDLIENPSDKKHPWLLVDWRPVTTFSTYAAKPEPKPKATPTFAPTPEPVASPTTSSTSVPEPSPSSARGN